MKPWEWGRGPGLLGGCYTLGKKKYTTLDLISPLVHQTQESEHGWGFWWCSLKAYEILSLLLYSVCMNVQTTASYSNHHSTDHLITILQGRLFSYSDTHRHRLGANYLQIPVNCPYRTRISNYQRDGPQTFTSNQEGAPNYYPNSFNGPEDVPVAAASMFAGTGDVARQAQWPYDVLEE